MKISVVIPAYNEEHYIAACIQSLKNQTVKPDEIIVVDNNSTDQTAAIAKAHGATVYEEAKQGMIHARNKAYDAATGDIIVRCDADSMALPNWIEKIKHHFEHEKIDALTGPVVYNFKHRNTLYCNFYSYTLKAILGYTILIGPNSAFRKSIWKQIRSSVCLDDKKVHEDIDISIHIHQHGGVVVYDPTLITKTSDRRIKKNPISFFIEYPARLIKTFNVHR